MGPGGLTDPASAPLVRSRLSRQANWIQPSGGGLPADAGWTYSEALHANALQGDGLYLHHDFAVPRHAVGEILVVRDHPETRAGAQPSSSPLPPGEQSRNPVLPAHQDPWLPGVMRAWTLQRRVGPHQGRPPTVVVGGQSSSARVLVQTVRVGMRGHPGQSVHVLVQSLSDPYGHGSSPLGCTVFFPSSYDVRAV
jgi:hypothetical protein